MAVEKIPVPHKMTLSDRKQLTMTGVSEVLGFEPTAIVIQTELGTLTVYGQELKLKTLSPEGGQLTLHGQISALIYEEPRKSRSWSGRLRL